MRPFKLFFQQLHWFLQLWRFSSRDISGSIQLRVENGGWHESLNLLHVSRCKMLHFVTSYMKQNKSRKQTLESAQYGLEISFKDKSFWILLSLKRIILLSCSPCSPDLSFSRWRRCYKSRGSFPVFYSVYLATEVQERSNAPVPSQKLATKVSKSRAVPPYVPGVNPPVWPMISA